MKRIFFLLLILIGAFPSLSQYQSSSLKPEDFTSKLSDYIIEYLQEKSYVVTDKPYYALGDTIWFNSFLVNALNHQSIALSNTVYVELLNAKGEILFSRMLLVREGIAPGEFPISEKWEPGKYQIRAYTKWMQNFSEAFIFYKNIAIYDIWPDSAIETPPSNPKIQGVNSKTGFPEIEIRLFPEGGNLIQGFPTMIGIKATFSGTENGVKVQGNLVDIRSSEILAPFKTDINGLGSFVFMQPTGAYKVVLDSPQFDLKYELIPVEVGTYGLKVVNRFESSNVHVMVETDIPSGLDGGYLIGHTRGEMFCNVVLEGLGTSQRKMISIESKLIPSGVAHFTFFDKWGVPRSERLIYMDHGDRLLNAIVQTDPEINKREKVELPVEFADSIKGFVTISVTNSEVVKRDSLEESLYSYLMFDSDIEGALVNPGYYLSEMDKNKYQILDNVMLTHGWRRFSWDDVLHSQSSPQKFRPEAGITLSGQLKNFTVRKKSETGIVQLVSMKLGSKSFSEGFAFNVVETDTSGRFFFNNLYFGDSVKFVFQSKKSESSVGFRYFIELDEYDYPTSRQLGDNAYFTNEGMEAFVEKSNKQFMIEKSFGKNVLMLDAVEVEAKGEDPIKDAVAGRYGNPDYRLIADSVIGQNYYLIDILRQIPFIQFDGYGRMTIRGVEPTVFLDSYELEPVVVADIINGTPGHDVYFIDADRSGFSNSRGIPIIYIYTKSGNGISLPTSTQETPGVLQITHPGYYKARQFFAPNYEPSSEPSAKPDHRLLLFWDPAVRIENGRGNVSFYVGDDRATYDVVIEGISKDGKVLTGKSQITVE